MGKITHKRLRYFLAKSSDHPALFLAGMMATIDVRITYLILGISYGLRFVTDYSFFDALEETLARLLKKEVPQ